jgi:Arc/MetJ-type ribon-helix-helix transcriptional regulator
MRQALKIENQGVHLRLPPELLVRLDALAQEWTDGISRPSRSAVIRRAVLLGLDKLEANQKKKQKG